MMTPETANSLFLGIVSGIITTALLWLFSSYRKNTFIPWYEKRLYKGVNIQGGWKLVDDEHDIKDAEEPWGQYETLNLKQVAHRLTGSSDLVPKKGVKSEAISLEVYGDISDRFVSLMMRSPTKSRLSYSVLLLEIVGDGNTLRGGTVMYDVSDEKISAYDVEYTRKK